MDFLVGDIAHFAHMLIVFSFVLSLEEFVLADGTGSGDECFHLSLNSD